MRKLNKEILQERSNKIHNYNYQIIGEYINSSTKIEIKHLVCGEVNKILPNNHFNGKGGCSKCFGSIKKTKEQLQEESNIIHNDEYEILGEYINSDAKIEIKHRICGNIFKQTPDKHLHNNKCPICYGKNRLTKEILQERSDKKYNGEYEILGNYINSATPILIKHKICGNEYMQIPNNHLRRRCFKCHGTPRKTNSEFQEISNKIHNNQYTLISDYIGANSIVKLLHNKCMKEFDIIAYSHLRGGKCSYCFNSTGENFINDYLLQNKIDFIRGKSFEGCKFKNKLRFDFYLPSYNMCIEYDGIQHFEAVEWFGGGDALKMNKIKDNIKSEWCEKNSINLVRISYKESIYDKLNEIFNI